MICPIKQGKEIPALEQCHFAPLGVYCRWMCLPDEAQQCCSLTHSHLRQSNEQGVF